MIVHNKLVAMASAFLLAGSVYAGQSQVCPDINHIKTVGLSAAEPLTAEVFFSYGISNYNTSTTWGFLIAPVKAQSAQMATDVANGILDTMTAPGVPDELNNEFVCLYNTGHQNILAAAMPADKILSTSKLKKLIQTVR
jgi:hypothetical protein